MKGGAMPVLILGGTFGRPEEQECDNYHKFTLSQFLLGFLYTVRVLIFSLLMC